MRCTAHMAEIERVAAAPTEARARSRAGDCEA